MRRHLLSSIVFLSTIVSLTHADLFTYTGPVVPIPNNDPNGATLTINVGSAFWVTQFSRVTMSFAVTHTFIGDLRAELVHVPSNTVVSLFNRPGVRPGSTFGDSTNMGGVYTFSNVLALTNGAQPRLIDNASTLSNGGTVANGVYRPTTNTLAGNGSPTFSGETITNLNVFDGLNAAGQWQLRIYDLAVSDVGSLASFEFEAIGTAVPEPGTMILCGLGVVGAGVFARRRGLVGRKA